MARERDELLVQCQAINERLPPAPWVADIDDPNTEPVFTGKFDHPPIPHTALALYDEPAAAADLATMRNLFAELLAALEVPPPASNERTMRRIDERFTLSACHVCNKRVQIKTFTDEHSLVVELALAIDDPAGLDALELAKALIAYGKAVPEERRLDVARTLAQWADSIIEHRKRVKLHA